MALELLVISKSVESVFANNILKDLYGTTFHSC